MADLKISQLTDGGNAQAADEFVVARSGSNFRIDGASVAAAATSVGTLTSLTVSGDLTVDTNTLSVNAANNRVGIGTTSAVWNSAEKLVVSQSVDAPVITGYSTFGAGTPVLVSWNSATSGTREHIWFADSASGGVRGKIATNGANGLQFLYGSTVGMSLDSSGNFIVDTNTLYVDAANNRVGVGTASPTAGYQLDVIGRGRFAPTASNYLADFISPESNGTFLQLYGDNSEGALIVNGTATKPFGLYVGGSRRLQVDTSGNLGLGVTPSGSYKMQVQSTNQLSALFKDTARYCVVQLESSGTNQNAYLDFKPTGTGAAIFQVGSIDRMTLDASGNLGVGTTSPEGRLHSANFQGTKQLILERTGSNSAKYAFTTSANSLTIRDDAQSADRVTIDASGNLGVGTTATAGVRLHQLTTAAIAEHRIECSDTSGVFSRWKSSAGDIGYFGQANVFIGGASSSNLGIASATGAITFGTGSTITERARITSTGSFTAQASTSVAAGTHSLQDNGSSPNTVRVYNNTDSNNTTNRFIICDAGASILRAEIRSNGGIANYSANNVALSDARIKTDITPAESMWGKVSALEIVTYKYVDQTHDDVNVGVIAQQVEAVEPIWVDNDGYGKTPEGEEPLKTVYTTDITFAAIKALQEAMARIEALEVEVAALKANA